MEGRWARACSVRASSTARRRAQSSTKTSGWIFIVLRVWLLRVVEGLRRALTGSRADERRALASAVRLCVLVFLCVYVCVHQSSSPLVFCWKRSTLYVPISRSCVSMHERRLCGIIQPGTCQSFCDATRELHARI